MKKDILDIVDDIIAISILCIMSAPVVLLVMLLFRGWMWLLVNINI